MPRKITPVTDLAPLGLAETVENSDDAGHRVQRLLGFWVVWHYFGGFDALEATGKWSRASLYKQRAAFRATFQCDVQDWVLGDLAPTALLMGNVRPLVEHIRLPHGPDLNIAGPE